MLIEVFKRFIKSHVIAEMPPELDDELVFGVLANAIARRTNIFPGFIRTELNQLVTFKNPLATKLSELCSVPNYKPGGHEFDELCRIITNRLEANSPNHP